MTDDDLDETARADRRRFGSSMERFRPEALVGLAEAEARSHVVAAGGEFDPYGPDDVLSADLNLNRVRAELVAGMVTDAWVG